MNRKQQYVSFFLLLISTFVLLAGCGPSAEEIATQTAEAWTPTPTDTPVPTDTPTPLPPTATPTPDPAALGPDPSKILENLNLAMQDITSYHFEMTMKMAVSMEGFSLEMPFLLVGDYQAPNRMRANMTMEFLGQKMEMEMVTIGDTAYATDPETGEWFSNANPEDITPFDPNDFVGSEEYDLEDPVLVGIEELDGVSVYHLSGFVSSSDFEELMGEEAGEGAVAIDFWIGVEDSLLRKITLSAEFSGSLMEEMEGDQEITMTVEILFSDFNAEISIEPPIE